VKTGQYFAGNFDPAGHTSADNLAWGRQMIDRHIGFWNMAPVALASSIFSNASPEFGAMQWEGREYVLGTDAAHKGIVARLPAGKWTVRRFDWIARTEATLATAASGEFTFDAPDSRAVLFHFKRN
jgi:hypothetical protein